MSTFENIGDGPVRLRLAEKLYTWYPGNQVTVPDYLDSFVHNAIQQGCTLLDAAQVALRISELRKQVTQAINEDRESLEMTQITEDDLVFEDIDPLITFIRVKPKKKQ